MQNFRLRRYLQRRFDSDKASKYKILPAVLFAAQIRQFLDLKMQNVRLRRYLQRRFMPYYAFRNEYLKKNHLPILPIFTDYRLKKNR